MTISGWKCDMGRNVETDKVSHSLQTFYLRVTLQASCGISEMAFLIPH